MAKKYYAVKVGKQPGIYETWDECKAQVNGFKGAIYQGFTSLDEAKQYLNQKETLYDVPVAYVDGSYNIKTKNYGSGAVILVNGTLYKLKKMGTDEEAANMRNVAGEIEACMMAMQFAVNEGLKELVIYHDYEGIAAWATGKWKANLVKTQAYVAFTKAMKEQLNFSFVKVKAHSNNQYNDMADELAKKACGLI